MQRNKGGFRGKLALLSATDSGLVSLFGLWVMGGFFSWCIEGCARSSKGVVESFWGLGTETSSFFLVFNH